MTLSTDRSIGRRRAAAAVGAVLLASGLAVTGIQLWGGSSEKQRVTAAATPSEPAPSNRPEREIVFVDEFADLPAEEVCDFLAQNVVLMVADVREPGEPELLELRSPNELRDFRESYRTPEDDGEALVVRCRAYGVWSDMLYNGLMLLDLKADSSDEVVIDWLYPGEDTD